MDVERFQDVINKCRVCFKSFIEDSDRIEITKEHENDFLALTQIELHKDANYSSYMCVSCDIHLFNSLAFMLQAKESQNRLYDFVPRSTEMLEKNEILPEDEPGVPEIAEEIEIRSPNYDSDVRLIHYILLYV